MGIAQGKRTDLVPNRHQVGRPTLGDASIDKKFCARAQKLAAVPEPEFEAGIAEQPGIDGAGAEIGAARRPAWVRAGRHRNLSLPSPCRCHGREKRSIETERQACEIRLRAERKARPARRSRRRPGAETLAAIIMPSESPLARHEGPKTLSELGISYDQSSRWPPLPSRPPRASWPRRPLSLWWSRWTSRRCGYGAGCGSPPLLGSDAGSQRRPNRLAGSDLVIVDPWTGRRGSPTTRSRSSAR